MGSPTWEESNPPSPGSAGPSVATGVDPALGFEAGRGEDDGPGPSSPGAPTPPAAEPAPGVVAGLRGNCPTVTVVFTGAVRTSPVGTMTWPEPLTGPVTSVKPPAVRSKPL